MTQENHRLGLDILVIIIEEGSRIILGFLPFLVLAEKEELKSGEEQLNFGLGSGRVDQKTDNSSDKKGSGETRDDPHDIEEDHRGEAEDSTDETHGEESLPRKEPVSQ